MLNYIPPACLLIGLSAMSLMNGEPLAAQYAAPKLLQKSTDIVPEARSSGYDALYPAGYADGGFVFLVTTRDGCSSDSLLAGVPAEPARAKYVCIPEPKGANYLVLDTANRRKAVPIHPSGKLRGFHAVPYEEYRGLRALHYYVMLQAYAEAKQIELGNRQRYGVVESRAPQLYERVDSILHIALAEHIRLGKLGSTTDAAAKRRLAASMTGSFNGLDTLRAAVDSVALVRYRTVQKSRMDRRAGFLLPASRQARAYQELLAGDFLRGFQVANSAGLSSGGDAASVESDVLTGTFGGLRANLNLQLSTITADTSGMDSSATGAGVADVAEVREDLALQHLLNAGGNLSGTIEYPIALARTKYNVGQLVVRAIGRSALSIPALTGGPIEDAAGLLSGGLSAFGVATGRSTRTFRAFGEARIEYLKPTDSYAENVLFDESLEKPFWFYHLRAGITVADVVNLDLTLLARSSRGALEQQGIVVSARFLGLK